MKKRKSNREEIEYYYVSGLASKNGTEYNVGRSIKFSSDENITYRDVENKFKARLEEDGYTFRFLWAWSLEVEN